jgi:tight adherence protein C
MMLLISVLIVASVSLVMWGAHPDMAKRIIQHRMHTELGEAERRSRLGWVRRLGPLIRLNRKIARPGERALDRFVAGGVALEPAEFLAVKQLSVALAVGLYLFGKGVQRIEPVELVIWGVVGFLIPELWLRQRIMRRRTSISRDLPEVVDLLNLCVEAGADFMGALQRVVREYRRCPLREELALVLQEVHVGKRRRDAFRALAERVQVPDVTSFSRTIVHADRMGTGMVQALRVLAEDTRLRRYNQADRYAQQAPLKMLLPLFFIMAAALLIVAGPVMIQFLRGDLFPKM